MAPYASQPDRGIAEAQQLDTAQQIRAIPIFLTVAHRDKLRIVYNFVLFGGTGEHGRIFSVAAIEFVIATGAAEPCLNVKIAQVSRDRIDRLRGQT